MISRHDVMNDAIERLKTLASQLTDGPVRTGIEALIADLEAEKPAALDQENGGD
jgi:hypothetical protein